MCLQEGGFLLPQGPLLKLGRGPHADKPAQSPFWGLRSSLGRHSSEMDEQLTTGEDHLSLLQLIGQKPREGT